MSIALLRGGDGSFQGINYEWSPEDLLSEGHGSPGCLTHQSQSKVTI